MNPVGRTSGRPVRVCAGRRPINPLSEPVAQRAGVSRSADRLDFRFRSSQAVRVPPGDEPLFRAYFPGGVLGVPTSCPGAHVSPFG